MKYRYFQIAFLSLLLSVSTAMAKGTYHYITPLQKAYMKAYSEIPKEALHPLRPLGMLSGCDGDWMSYNHNGVAPNGIPDPALEAAVCGLMDILPTAYKDSFMVFDYGMYPPLTFIDRGAAHDNAFNCMKAKVENDYNPPFYLLMGKQINPEDGSVEFRVALHLPRHNEFSDLNSTLEVGFSGSVLGAIKAHHGDWGDLSLLVYDEIAGIEKLTELLQVLLNGGYSGNLTTSMLDLNGFQELAIHPSYPLNWRKIANPGTPSGNIRDYAQREVFYDLAGDYVPVGGQASGALSDLANLFSGSIILTDNTNYSPGTGTTNKFEDANTDFESRTEDLMVWLHYFEPADTSQPKQLFIKYKVNISQEEAQNKINDLFENFKIGNLNALTGGGSEDKSKMSNEKNLDCGNFDCSSFTKWRAYCCLRSYIEGGQISVASLAVLGLDPNAATIETAKYLAALGCGAVDGVLEMLAFVGNVTSFVDEALEATPGTFSWFSDLFSKAWEKGSFKEAFQIKLEEDKAFWGGVYDKFVQFATFLKNLSWSSIEAFFVAIWEQLKHWAGKITGQNGVFEAGYEMGRFVFDMIFDYLTFGSKKFVDIGKDALGTLIKLMDGSGANMKKYMQLAWDSEYVTSTQKTLCKIGIGGCFVKGTPVMMAGMLAIPIENVQLFDWVLSNTTVNNVPQGLMTSINDDLLRFNNDPYTSDQQKQRDQYELNDNDWYEVSFQELIGGSHCKLALHKDWMAQNGMEEVGSIHELNLPEQGIQGPNIITSIKHILPQKKPADEDPDDDFEYRPVTGIFVHSSNDVWTLHFDIGDSLGVTSNHPIFSTTFNGWRIAGDLQEDEQVLTKDGYAVVASKERREGSQEVHNLEVQGLHNFLVGRDGIVVHNNYKSLIAQIKSMSPAQLKQHIADGWEIVIKSSDDVPDFFGARKYFQELMEEFKYKSLGFKSTTPLADNFKAIDFYKEVNVSGNIITANKVVSMKTTAITDVNTWKNYTSVKDNIQFLKDGLVNNSGIEWNNKIIKYTSPEIHIFMPEDKFTQSIANNWKSTLEALHPQIKFKVSTLEKYIK